MLFSDSAAGLGRMMASVTRLVVGSACLQTSAKLVLKDGSELLDEQRMPTSADVSGSFNKGPVRSILQCHLCCQPLHLSGLCRFPARRAVHLCRLH